MKLSHSKLETIIKCPMSYYLNYVQEIKIKTKKSALAIGSAVHWGIEHNTEDLSDHYKEEGTFKQQDNYTQDQLLAEAMVHGYLKHKDEIFEEILTDPITKEKLILIDESHELYLTGKLKSFKKEIENHDFIGIIDLLLLTNKGFIIIDYKTSSMEPDWDKYLDQIYRYIMLLQTTFPEVPICKIGIINLRKSRIKQKAKENEQEFLNRLRLEYELNDEKYVNYHEYPMNDINDKLLNYYINNLSKMADCADTIEKSKNWYINYNEANGVYGKSDFYDIFYHTPNAYILYNISDYIYDENEECFKDIRDCVQLDMEVIDYDNCLNKYSIFKEEYEKADKNISYRDFIDILKQKYRTDDYLLNIYQKTLIQELKSTSK